MSYYLKNTSTTKVQSVGTSSIDPGETLSFDTITPEIIWAVEGGSCTVYDAESNLVVDLSGYAVEYTETPLDPDIAASLPTYMRVPTRTYYVIPPEAGWDPIITQIPSSAFRTLLADSFGILRVIELQQLDRPLILDSQILVDISGIEQGLRIPKLAITSSQVETIGDIGKMKGLVHLDLSNNAISDVANLDQLNFLEHLNFSSNLLTSFPSIRNMERMRYLDIRDNDITESGINQFIIDAHYNRFNWGQHNTIIRLEGNVSPNQSAIEMIEGTGSYLNNGLKSIGCVVTYDAAV